MVTVSIIIVNYQQWDFLIPCITSIYNTICSIPFEVIVVDNSPIDLPFEQIKLDYPDIHLIKNSNRGFSHANNIGVTKAKGEYLLFINPDTLVKSDFLGSLIKAFAGEKFGAVGCKLYFPDGVFQLSFWKEVNFCNEIRNKRDEKKFEMRDLKFIHKVETEYSKIREVDWVSGACMLIRKNVFNSIQGFNERYFLYYEDADICKRLRRLNLPIYFYPYSEIIHYKGKNVNDKFYSELYFFMKKSQLIYYKLHNDLLNRLLIRFYIFLKFFLKFLKGFNRKQLLIAKLAFKKFDG
ncbi:MAG: glycosyltransferase family 2 protein [Ignavibacteria bacterium]